MRSGSRFTLAVLIPAAVTVVESAGGEELFTIPIAPFAHAALAQDPADQTLGVIPVKDNATTEVVFFKPIPNSYEAEYDVAGSDYALGLRAAFPVTINLPAPGEYMFRLMLRQGCYQFMTSQATRERGIWWYPLEADGRHCYGTCDQCKKKIMGCAQMDSFFLCSDDPRGDGTNPASTMSLESCDPITTVDPYGRARSFPAGNVTLYIAARETCSVASRLRVYASPFPSGVDPYRTKPHFTPRHLMYPMDFVIFVALEVGLLSTAAVYCYITLRRRRRHHARLWTATPETGTNAEDAQVTVIQALTRRTFGSRLEYAGLRVRVSGCLLIAGLTLLTFGLSPLIRNWLTGSVSVLPFQLLASFIGPGILLMLLAVFPTDRRVIRAVATLAILVLLVLGAFIVLMLQSTLAAADCLAVRSAVSCSYMEASWRASTVENATMQIALLVIILTSLFALFSPRCRQMPPRRALLRLWATARGACAAIGLVNILYKLIPLATRGRTEAFIQEQSNQEYESMWLVAFTTSGFVLVVSAALATATNRGRVHRWLATLVDGGSQLRKAAVISSMLGDSFADIALKRAQASFYAIEFSELKESFFADVQGSLAPVHTRPHTRPHHKKIHAGRHSQRMQGTRSEPNVNATERRLEAAIEDVPRYCDKELKRCELGRCDAFVSHAHIDELLHPGEKFPVLMHWVERYSTETSAPAVPLLWIDGVCLHSRNMNYTLPLLPIFIVGCKRFVALAGIQYTSRLWTTMELFTFVQAGGEPANFVTLPIGGVSATNLLSSFDVRATSCARQGDHDMLLAVVEASFGELRAFNEVMRRLVLVDEGAHDA